MKNEYNVMFTWDNEADVWIATSEDIHGLILEHESLDVLFNRVRCAVPELLAYEKPIVTDISIDYSVFRKESLTLNG